MVLAGQAGGRNEDMAFLSCLREDFPNWNILCGDRPWISRYWVYMHVNMSGARRWQRVSTLKNQCKTSEVGQLRTGVNKKQAGPPLELLPNGKGCQ